MPAPFIMGQAFSPLGVPMLPAIQAAALAAARGMPVVAPTQVAVNLPLGVVLGLPAVSSVPVVMVSPALARVAERVNRAPGITAVAQAVEVNLPGVGPLTQPVLHVIPSAQRRAAAGARPAAARVQVLADP